MYITVKHGDFVPLANEKIDTNGKFWDFETFKESLPNDVIGYNFYNSRVFIKINGVELEIHNVTHILIDERQEDGKNAFYAHTDNEYLNGWYSFPVKFLVQ